MKHFILIVVLLAGGSLLTAQTSDSLSAGGIDDKIARLLELSGAEAQFLGAIDNMLAMQQQQIDSTLVPTAYWAEISKEAHQEGWQLILPELTAVYRNNMTEEEIDYQIAYFNSPMGQQIVAKQGTIMQQSMAVGQRWGMDMGARVAQRLQEAMEKE